MHIYIYIERERESEPEGDDCCGATTSRRYKRRGA